MYISLTSSVDNTVVALRCTVAVTYVKSTSGGSESEMVMAAMRQPFPEITHLRIGAYDAPIIPDTFLGGSAPRLQYLQLEHIPISGITETIFDVLYGIPQSGYIPSDVMITCLSALIDWFKFERVRDDIPHFGPLVYLALRPAVREVLSEKKSSNGPGTQRTVILPLVGFRVCVLRLLEDAGMVAFYFTRLLLPMPEMPWLSWTFLDCWSCMVPVLPPRTSRRTILRTSEVAMVVEVLILRKIIASVPKSHQLQRSRRSRRRAASHPPGRNREQVFG